MNIDFQKIFLYLSSPAFLIVLVIGAVTTCQGKSQDDTARLDVTSCPGKQMANTKEQVEILEVNPLKGETSNGY